MKKITIVLTILAIMALVGSVSALSESGYNYKGTKTPGQTVRLWGTIYPTSDIGKTVTVIPVNLDYQPIDTNNSKPSWISVTKPIIVLPNAYYVPDNAYVTVPMGTPPGIYKQYIMLSESEGGSVGITVSMAELVNITVV
jgi:hypothetical protein